MNRAAATIQRQNNQLKAVREEKKAGTHALINGAVGLASAGIAGLIDAKWGSSTAPAKVKGIPVVPMVAAATLVAAVIPSPIQGAAAQSTMQLIGITLYRYEIDNVHFES